MICLDRDVGIGDISMNCNFPTHRHTKRSFSSSLLKVQTSLSDHRRRSVVQFEENKTKDYCPLFKVTAGYQHRENRIIANFVPPVEIVPTSEAIHLPNASCRNSFFCFDFLLQALLLLLPWLALPLLLLFRWLLPSPCCC